MIRVKLPHHLRKLAMTSSKIELSVIGPVTQRTVIESLERRCPMLRGTLRDRVTHRRRPFVRFFADGRDLSHDSPLHEVIQDGTEPLLIVGAMAGG